MVAIKVWALELIPGSLNYKFSRIVGCSHRHTPSPTLILHSGGECGVSREMIGKYERGDAVPSIEAAKKIADAFGVSLDYLVGEGVNSSFDKKNVKRLQDIEKLLPEDREHIFALMDSFLFKCQVQNSLSV
ncbi:helix-turn-helix transcriptional regulator [Algoriphagus sp. AGSA1]|uniref:helix-turn-helix domain-containing protein n=1 Tax=Algoriphagus sp. AGSA1 TaxID=2907213 RepID=UPI001F3ADCF7|nr:helix-turn-helix transcriptional regulator [Algoriphagus sp. AGSA1]MCE7057730.1 helix-turn-helix transcriptional regulator [Algoriphagus sp. AGSA1]